VSVGSDDVACWRRRSLVGLSCLVVLAPVFAWASAQTGYAEPMDNAVELAGMTSATLPPSVSLLSGYALPGLGPYLGTLGGGLLGTALTFSLAVAVGRLLSARNR
jgi:cobalt/nickel transport protein